MTTPEQEREELVTELVDCFYEQFNPGQMSVKAFASMAADFVLSRDAQREAEVTKKLRREHNRELNCPYCKKRMKTFCTRECLEKTALAYARQRAAGVTGPISPKPGEKQ